MRKFVVIILHTAVAQVQEPTDKVIDKFASSLVDTLFERASGALKASLSNDADLDDSTLAKTPAVQSGSTLSARASQVPVLRSPFTSPRSSVPVSGLSPLGDFASPWAGYQRQFRVATPNAAPQENKAGIGTSKLTGLKENTAVERRKARVEGTKIGARAAKGVEEKSKAGAKDGFKKTLQLVGTGYKAAMKGKNLILKLGFSHEVEVEPWQTTKYAIDKPGTQIDITGNSKEEVGTIAARIRDIRPPEPYGGKGVRYLGEVIKLKAGKQGKK